MDKPISLPVKDWLIRKMAVKMMMSEAVLNAVISHQFQSANEALSSCNSVEISGFGKLYFNYKKAQKKMERMLLQREYLFKQLDVLEEGRKKEAAKLKIESLTNAIEILKPKLYENKLLTDIRGMEEQTNSTSPSEGTDKCHL